MRKTRRLTTGERWELGLFLTMIIVGCLCVTAILNLDSLPHLFAFTSRPPEKATLAPAVSTNNNTPPAPSNFSALPATAVLPPLASVTPPAVFPAFLPPASIDTTAPKKRSTVDIKLFNGQKYRFAKTLRLRVTAYAPDARCCWPYPGTTTASGMSVKTNRGRLVAADTRLIPMHALVSVPGYANGAPVPVLDRGGAIKGHRLDVLMPTFDRAADWGSRTMDVKIYMPIDE